MKRFPLAASFTSPCRRVTRTLIGFIGIALLLAFVSNGRASDTIYTWDYTGSATSAPTADGSGTWSTSNSNWYNSGGDAGWSNTANTSGATSEAYIGVTNTGGPYTLTLGSNINVNEISFGATGGSPVYTIAGDSGGLYSIDLVGTTPEINVSTTSATAIISAPITGSAGLDKIGGGGLTIMGTNNTYTGITNDAVGALNVGATNALPTATNLEVTGTFSLKGVNQTVGRLSEVSSGGIRNGSTTSSATLTIGSGGSAGGTDTIAGDVRDGNLSDVFNLTIDDSATVETLSGANNYSGATTIDLGTLIISSDANLGGNAGTVAVTSSTSSKSVTGIALNVNTQAIGVGTVMLGTTVTALNSSSQLTLAQNAAVASGTVNYATAGNLDLNGGILEANGTFSLSESSSSGAGGTATVNRAVIIGASDTGTIDVTGSHVLTVPGVVSGSTGSLTKTDTGTLILSGANTYGGATTVNGGTLNLTGSLSTATTASVAAGAQFALGTPGESGTVNQTLTSLTLNSTGISTTTEAQLSFNLGATTNDSLTTTGAFTLNLTGGATAFNLVLNDGGTLPTGPETLLTWGSGGITTSQIDLTNSSSGITASDLSVQGNSLIFSAPEPGTDALLLGGVALLAFYYQRRRKVS